MAVGVRKKFEKLISILTNESASYTALKIALKGHHVVIRSQGNKVEYCRRCESEGKLKCLIEGKSHKNQIICLGPRYNIECEKKKKAEKEFIGLFIFFTTTAAVFSLANPREEKELFFCGLLNRSNSTPKNKKQKGNFSSR